MVAQLLMIGFQDVPVDLCLSREAENSTGLQAVRNHLGLERFGIRASLAHANPGDKYDGVRLKISGHHRP